MKISIVDYGVGNLLSVKSAVETCGFDAELASSPEAILNAEKLILPGVGAFSRAMDSLKDKGFIASLNESVLEKKTPVLGICLGMQLMAKHSAELEGGEGLGWFDAHVVRLQPQQPHLKVPQIGWNSVSSRPLSPLFKGVEKNPVFYFVHSFHMQFESSTDPCLEGTCEYGQTITAAVRKEHIFATQFHPEKSSQNGLKLLENFLRWSA